MQLVEACSWSSLNSWNSRRIITCGVPASWGCAERGMYAGSSKGWYSSRYGRRQIRSQPAGSAARKCACRLRTPLTGLRSWTALPRNSRLPLKKGSWRLMSSKEISSRWVSVHSGNNYRLWFGLRPGFWGRGWVDDQVVGNGTYRRRPARDGKTVCWAAVRSAPMKSKVNSSR